MVVEIVLCMLSIILTFFSYYLFIKNKIRQSAEDAVNNAEELDKIGKEKMKIAVAQVRNVIPISLKPFFSEELIEQIIQEIFDKMKCFAEKQVEKEKNDGGHT